MTKIEDKKLTPKQEMFVQEYLVDLNGTQAAIRAGYSKNSAGVIASQNLCKLNIQRRISEAKASRVKRLEISQDRVLKEIARLAFFDIRKLYKDDGSLVDIKDMDDDTAAAIGGVDVVMSGGDEPVETKKIKLVDKKRPLEMLGRHLKMFTDKVDMQLEGELEVKVLPAELMDIVKKYEQKN